METSPLICVANPHCTGLKLLASLVGNLQACWLSFQLATASKTDSELFGSQCDRLATHLVNF